MPIYKEHHEQYSHTWVKEEGTPVQVAIRLIDRWNGNLREGEVPYSKTPAFIRSLGTLIFLRRKGINLQTMPDDDKEASNIDPLCLSCRKCQSYK